MTRGSRCPVCIEMPIVMDYVKCSAKISGFSSLWDSRNVSIHSPSSPASKNTFATWNKKLKIFRHNFHVILGSISVENLMFFIVKTPFLASVLAKGKVLTAQSIKFSMKIDPKITWKLCPKNNNFLFHVANVFFDAGELEECMETFLESSRLEKPLFFALYFT